MTIQISNNFSLKEFTRSVMAQRMGLDNHPSVDELENLSELCDNILQPLREQVGQIKILSGFRSVKLNAAVGGSSKSQHCKGEAADIEASNFGNKELFGFIADTFKFDQLILEFYAPGDPHSGWIHVSRKRAGNRGMKLAAVKENGKTIYKVINSKEDLENL